MSPYEKSEIRKGIFLELDCSIRTVIRPQPQPYAEVSQRLEHARERLEALLEGVRNARLQYLQRALQFLTQRHGVTLDQPRRVSLTPLPEHPSLIIEGVASTSISMLIG